MSPGTLVAAQGKPGEPRCCGEVPIARSISLPRHRRAQAPARAGRAGYLGDPGTVPFAARLCRRPEGCRDHVRRWQRFGSGTCPPGIRDRGLTATFFVIAGRLGVPRFLDEAGVRALAAAGMEIGCHGMHHRRWRGLDQSALHEELVEAKAILEQTVEKAVTQAACPFGSYDRRVLRALRRCGYRHVFTSDGGLARPGDFLQARNSVGPHDAPGLLEQVSARDAGLSSAARRRAKLAIKRWRSEKR